MVSDYTGCLRLLLRYPSLSDLVVQSASLPLANEVIDDTTLAHRPRVVQPAFVAKAQEIEGNAIGTITAQARWLRENWGEGRVAGKTIWGLNEKTLGLPDVDQGDALRSPPLVSSPSRPGGFAIPELAQTLLERGDALGINRAVFSTLADLRVSRPSFSIVSQC